MNDGLVLHRCKCHRLLQLNRKPFDPVALADILAFYFTWSVLSLMEMVILIILWAIAF